MTGLYLKVLPGDSVEPVQERLEVDASGSAQVSLRCPEGAAALHLEVVDEDRVPLARAEIEAAGGEEVAVRVRMEDEVVVAESRGRRVRLLPSDLRYAPALPIEPRGEEASLDLLFLVDGTAKTGLDEGAEVGEPAGVRRYESLRPLLSDEEAWEGHVEFLLGIAQALCEKREDCRVGVLAFADEPPPEATAPDLKPAYLLHPAPPGCRNLRPYEAPELRRSLLSVPASSGGDFVDALAEGLAKCADLPWRGDARKVVVLSGDSPGFSLLHPAPRGADARVRRLTVDAQADELHRRGVEIVTIYNDAAEQAGVYTNLRPQKSLLEHARLQYARLASWPGLAFRLSTVVAERIAGTLAATPDLLARGASYGILAGERSRTEGPGGAVEGEEVSSAVP